VLSSAHRLIRLTITISILVVAAVVVVILWDYYTASPWTRNGQVRVQVANIAPRVSGQILHVNVQDNQPVHHGDVLYEIDPFDFQVAVDAAKAKVAERKADMEFKQVQAEWRKAIPGVAVSQEEKKQYVALSQQAAAQYASAQACVSGTNGWRMARTVRKPWAPSCPIFGKKTLSTFPRLGMPGFWNVPQRF